MCVCVCVCVCVLVTQLYPTLQPRGLKSARLPCPWDFPGKNPGVGCHFVLQEIFPALGLNLGLLHCRRSLPSEPPGNPGGNNSREFATIKG